MSETLADAVAAAVAAFLEDRVEIDADVVIGQLPEHVRRGKPSKKLVAKAVIDLGWRRMKRKDGTVFYRAPQAESDPLNRPGDSGGNIAADQLVLLIERIERLEEEKKGVADDIKDVYGEAKAVGYDVKTIRKIVQLRKMDKHARDEADALLETYRNALGMA